MFSQKIRLLTLFILSLSLSKGGLSIPAGIALDPHKNLVIAESQSLAFINSQTGAILNSLHSSIGDPAAAATPLTVSNFDE